MAEYNFNQDDIGLNSGLSPNAAQILASLQNMNSGFGSGSNFGQFGKNLSTLDSSGFGNMQQGLLSGSNVDGAGFGGSGYNWNTDSLSGIGTNPTGGGFDFKGGMKTAGTVLGALNSLNNLWGSYQANKRANAQFKFAKQFATKNLANSTQAYNTALDDKISSRASYAGLSQEQVDSYKKEHSLTNL